MSSIFEITPAPAEGETPWFKGGELPGQPGVFKRIYYTADGWGKPSYCKWDGEKWYSGADTPDKALDEPMMPSHYQPFMRDGFDFAWCGLMPVEIVSDNVMQPAEAGEDSQLDLPLGEPADNNASFFEG